MDRIDALRAHLLTLPPSRVLALLRELPRDMVDAAGTPQELLPSLADALQRAVVFETLTAAQYELLAAAADIAEAESDRPRSHSWTESRYLPFLGVSPAVSVDPQALLEQVSAADGPQRQVAEQALAGLLERAVLWPGRAGRHHLALGVDTAFSGRGSQRIGVMAGLTQAYNLPELRRIALALGADPTRRRAEVQAEVVSQLTDKQRLHALLDQAPPEAAELAGRLAQEASMLATYCFQGGGEYGEAKFRFRSEGSGDPGTDWLAERGLLIPVAVERAVLPHEVAEVVRTRGTSAFAPRPAAPAGVPASEESVAAQAQVSVLAFLEAVDRLVAEVAERPAALRKSGGVTVRDRKRLAKAMDTGAEQARLWIETAYAAGLLIEQDGHVAAADWADDWQASEAADRLLPLLGAWWGLPDAPTWWPEDQDPVIPGQSHVTGAVALRQGILTAMADLPEGRGSGVTAENLLVGDDTPLTALEELLATAEWYRPAARSVEHTGPVLAHTFSEAELLGLVAHGVATRLGRSVAEENDDGIRRALVALLPSVEQTARFQGDMTAVVTGTPSARLDALLSTVADRESGGYASTWRLSPASMRRALDAGHTAEDLVKELTEVSVDGVLPQTVEYLIHDTARGHGRMRVLPAACCVRSDEPALVREMAGNRGLRSLRLRAVADTVLVSAKPAGETLAVLRREGYAPVQEDETGDAVVQPVSGAGASRTGGAPPFPGCVGLLAAARSLSGQS